MAKRWAAAKKLQAGNRLMCISCKSGYTGYTVDHQSLKWLHNWLHFFESGYIVDNEKLKWLHYHYWIVEAEGFQASQSAPNL
jgi:hypothetical protein